MIITTHPIFATNTAIIMFKNINKLAVIFTFLIGLPLTVLINIEDHFLAVLHTFKRRCGLLPFPNL